GQEVAHLGLARPALIQGVLAISNAFRQYLELSKKPKEGILAKLVAAGYTTDEAGAECRRPPSGSTSAGTPVRCDDHEHPGRALGRAPRRGGLSGGGTKMSMRENGDFMHFDCRNTAFGYAVYAKTAPRHR
ncbi:MAG TPA: hypothetical protein VF469_19440, partial [Kofleriaceae bacterium]